MFIILSSASKMHSKISSSFLGAGRSSGCEHGCITPFMSIYRLSNSTPFGLAPDKSTWKRISKEITLYGRDLESDSVKIRFYEYDFNKLVILGNFQPEMVIILLGTVTPSISFCGSSTQLTTIEPHRRWSHRKNAGTPIS